MAGYIKSLPTAFVVRVYTSAIPDFAKMYPNLVEGPLEGEAWDIYFTWYALPQKLRRVSGADAAKSGSGSMEIVSYNPGEIGRKCRVMVVERRGRVYATTTLIDAVKKLFP